MNTHNHFAVISFGLGGNSLTGVSADGNPVTSFWYLRGTDEFLASIPDHYKPEEIDGAYVIDKRDLLRENPMLAITATMCDARLADEAGVYQPSADSRASLTNGA